MIPAQNIVAWGNVVRWADQRQVEQDLIISVCAAYDPLISGLPYWLGSGEPSSDVSEGG